MSSTELARVVKSVPLCDFIKPLTFEEKLAAVQQDKFAIRPLTSEQRTEEVCVVAVQQIYTRFNMLKTKKRTEEV